MINRRGYTKQSVIVAQNKAKESVIEYLFERDTEHIMHISTHYRQRSCVLKYTSRRETIAGDMVKRFNEAGFKARFLFWRNLATLFTEEKTYYIKVTW